MKTYKRILTAAFAFVMICACFSLPFSVSAAEGDVLFSEDFSSGLKPGWKVSAGADYTTAAEVVDGTFHFASTANKAARTSVYLLYEIPENVTAYTIYTEFKVAKFGDGENVAQRQRPIGAAFNLPDSADVTWQAAVFTGETDVLNVDMSGYQNNKSVEAFRCTDSPLMYPIEDNVWYAVEVKVNDIDFVISATVKKLTDDGWTDCWTAYGKNATGAPGFGRYVGILNRGNDMYVDNFKVTDNSPAAADTTITEEIVTTTDEPVATTTDKPVETTTDPVVNTTEKPADTTIEKPSSTTTPNTGSSGGGCASMSMPVVAVVAILGMGLTAIIKKK